MEQSLLISFSLLLWLLLLLVIGFAAAICLKCSLPWYDSYLLYLNTFHFRGEFFFFNLTWGNFAFSGAYDDEEAAAHAYDLAALKYWGQDTILNFPVSAHYCLF